MRKCRKIGRRDRVVREKVFDTDVASRHKNRNVVKNLARTTNYLNVARLINNR